jgi:hypothetical protein
MPVATSVQTQEYAAPGNHSTGIGNAWISLVLGLLFTWLGFRFAKWAVATISGRTFDTGIPWTSGDKAGQMVEYWEIYGYAALTDMAMFTIGVALLLDALILFFAIRRGSVNRLLVMLGAGITAIALLVNIGVCVKLLGAGVTPIFSIVAILVGGFMFFDHVAMLHRKGESGSRDS